MEQLTFTAKGFESGFDVERELVFDCMAPHWDTMVPPVPAEKIEELISAADVKDKTVLDVGAGTGILVEAGLAADPKRWIACDLSSEMLKKVEFKLKSMFHWDGASASSRRVVMLHADVHSLPLDPASVDRVLCHNAFPHFHRPKAALAELFRVLRPGGLLLINHFSGREVINQVHRSAPHAILHADLLAPAEEASQWLVEVGFTVTGVIDSPQMYRIMAVRPAGK